jgi:hypothetical protein
VPLPIDKEEKLLSSEFVLTIRRSLLPPKAKEKKLLMEDYPNILEDLEERVYH